MLTEKNAQHVHLSGPFPGAKQSVNGTGKKKVKNKKRDGKPPGKIKIMKTPNPNSHHHHHHGTTAPSERSKQSIKKNRDQSFVPSADCRGWLAAIIN